MFTHTTEEEISAMKIALEKYGINLPSFGKIGGILANEVHVHVRILQMYVVYARMFLYIPVYIYRYIICTFFVD